MKHNYKKKKKIVSKNPQDHKALIVPSFSAKKTQVFLLNPKES